MVTLSRLTAAFSDFVGSDSTRLFMEELNFLGREPCDCRIGSKTDSDNYPFEWKVSIIPSSDRVADMGHTVRPG